jgi:hypothetical protein
MNEDTTPWGYDDTQSGTAQDIAERPTIPWLRIATKEPAPATLRLGSSTMEEANSSTE